MLVSDRKCRCVPCLVCLCFCFAASAPAYAVPQRFAISPPPAASQFAIADFDGDDRPDIATVQADHADLHRWLYRVALHFGSGVQRSVALAAPSGGLRIESRDVNGDSFLDIVVTTLWENEPVTILLNDGQGNFTPSDPARFPSAFDTAGRSRLAVSDEIPETSAALLSRQLCGKCGLAVKYTSLVLLFGSIHSSTSRVRALPFAASFSGRAPPALRLIAPSF